MPKNDSTGKKTKQWPIQLVEVNATPAELGAFLRDKCDVVILGEDHVSVPAGKVQGTMFEVIDPPFAFIESSPSLKNSMNDRNAKMSDTWGAKDFGVRPIALKNGNEIVPVDIEHCKSPESVKVITGLALLRGNNEAYFTALDQAAKEVELSGRKFKIPKPQNESFAAFQQSVNQVISENRDVLSPHNIENVSKTGEVYAREIRGEPKPMLEKIEEFFSPPVPKINQKWFDLRNETMATGIEQKLGDPNAHRHASTFTVGMKHNEAVEKKLESKGFQVANVKVVPTTNPLFDKKVYQNLKPSSREDAEWIVTVFDKKEGEDLTKYSIVSDERCRKPAEIPKAKIVLQEISK